MRWLVICATFQCPIQWANVSEITRHSIKEKIRLTRKIRLFIAKQNILKTTSNPKLITNSQKPMLFLLRLNRSKSGRCSILMLKLLKSRCLILKTTCMLSHKRRVEKLFIPAKFAGMLTPPSEVQTLSEFSYNCWLNWRRTALPCSKSNRKLKITLLKIYFYLIKNSYKHEMQRVSETG